MTVLRKCETCRARKIKCDEALPACRACAQAGRQCIYRYKGRGAIFVNEQSEPRARGRGLGPLSEKPIAKDGCTAVGGADGHLQHEQRSAHRSLPARLRFKRSREAGDGAGRYITFISRADSRDVPGNMQNSSATSTAGATTVSWMTTDDSLAWTPPSSPLWSPETGLGLQWIAVLDAIPGPAPNDVFDTWTRFIPACLGNARCLNLAAAYYIDSMKSFLHQTGAARSEASATGQRALHSLRQAVGHHAPGRDSGDLLLTIVLHRYAESLRGQKTDNHVAHVRAIAQVLRGANVKVLKNEVVASVVCATYEDELVEAVLNGEDSQFDTDGVYAPSPSMSGMTDALFAMQDLYVRIPRLVRLTRSALQRPVDGDAQAEAVQLAKTLHASPQEACILDVLANEMCTALASSGLLPAFIGSQCYNFASLESYVLATQYYSYRILLCGLIQSLCTLKNDNDDVVDKVFDLEAVQAADVAAATAVAMFVGYALGSPRPHPVRAFRLQVPLQVAFGAWHRMEKRQSSSLMAAVEFDDDYDKAVQMKEWTANILDRIDQLWESGPPIDPRVMEASCEMAAGGPMTAGMAIWRDGR